MQFLVSMFPEFMFHFYSPGHDSIEGEKVDMIDDVHDLDKEDDDEREEEEHEEMQEVQEERQEQVEFEHNIKTEEQATDAVMQDQMFIVGRSELVQLATKDPISICTYCTAPVKITMKKKGSGVTINWVSTH